jgi:hypothetical protein
LPDFLFFLAVDADFRLFFACEPLAEAFDIPHLPIAALIFLTTEALAIGAQGIS